MATTTKDVAGSVDSMEVLQMRDGLRRTETHTLLPDPEPRERKYLIFSVDDHFLEPANLYEGRLPSKFADVAPRIVEDEDGVEYWLYEGKMEPNLSSNGTVGRPMEEWTLQALRYDEFRPGVWDPKARIKDMDIDGVWVSLNFPSVGIGFCGQRFMRMKDRDLALACMRAYNDWIIDEWCATAPDRFIPVQVTWLHDPQLAADEIRANAERGFKGLFFSENPSKLGLPSIHTGYWDPVMQACAETDTIIQMHGGSASWGAHPSPDSPWMTDRALFPVGAQMAAADYIFSQIPLRFPNLRFILSEGGAGWVPALHDRLWDVQKELDNPNYDGEWPLDIDEKPTDILLRNFRFSSLYDPTAFALVDRIGAENLLIESDYPHQDTMWPDTQAVTDEQLRHLPADVVAKITHGNAADLFRMPIPAESVWKAMP